MTPPSSAVCPIHCPPLPPNQTKVSNILTRATSRSLVLLDEFGKGTLSADGVGLLAALLQHYAAQPSPPLLLACTHFSELLDPGEKETVVSCVLWCFFGREVVLRRKCE